MTASASLARAAGSATSATPCERKRSSASRCRCTLADTSKPARRNAPAIGSPIAPSPTKPMRAITSGPFGRGLRITFGRRRRRDSMTAAVTPTIARPTFDAMNLSVGKRTRLHRLMYEHGPANGTLMMLPIDQGLEHGPVDFFDNPEAIDTDWIYRLAVEGNFSGIALHVGLAEKYQKQYAGRVPLLLKVNGKTNIPPDDEAFSPLTSSVEDAIRLGADAVGYTLYVGSPAQEVDIAQCNEVRRDCDRYGMPLVVWAYPRGSAVKAK